MSFSFVICKMIYFIRIFLVLIGWFIDYFFSFIEGRIKEKEFRL